LVTAAAVAVSLVFFTPLFFYLPKAVLAAIIMTAVMNLFEVREVVRLWRLARRDAVLLLITLGATLSLGIEQGIVLGLLASLGLMIYGRSKGDPSMKRFDIEPGITSAGQPSPEQLQGLAQEGFKTVIDLRAAGEAGHPADEAEIVERLGLGYRHLPITGPGDVNRETAETLAKLLDQGEGPVLVHCGSANRVGALLALKAKFVDGLSSAEALDYGKRAGLTDLSAHVEQTLG
ncbi:MAG: sulfur transferase domain-containing protein, partial [Myxococcota bacterium]